MNVGEFGIVFRFGVGFNIASQTSLRIDFTKPDDTILTVNDPQVTVGTSDVETSLGTFKANEYAEYTFVDGDVDLAGDWSARLTYQDATPQKLISDVGTFEIFD